MQTSQPEATTTSSSVNDDPLVREMAAGVERVFDKSFISAPLEQHQQTSGFPNWDNFFEQIRDYSLSEQVNHLRAELARCKPAYISAMRQIEAAHAVHHRANEPISVEVKILNTQTIEYEEAERQLRKWEKQQTRLTQVKAVKSSVKTGEFRLRAIKTAEKIVQKGKNYIGLYVVSVLEALEALQESIASQRGELSLAADASLDRFVAVGSSVKNSLQGIEIHIEAPQVKVSEEDVELIRTIARLYLLAVLSASAALGGVIAVDHYQNEIRDAAAAVEGKIENIRDDIQNSQLRQQIEDLYAPKGTGKDPIHQSNSSQNNGFTSGL